MAEHKVGPRELQLRSMREARYVETQAKRKAAPVSNVNNKPVIHKAPPLSTSNAARQEKWRKANEDLSRLRVRDAMRKKRVKNSAHVPLSD